MKNKKNPRPNSQLIENEQVIAHVKSGKLSLSSKFSAKANLFKTIRSFCVFKNLADFLGFVWQLFAFLGIVAFVFLESIDF